jgi:type I restriction enzyme S subunit
MNAERLLVHYEKIVDAPDAIPRLRRFVLDLAVRGKLVPQDPNDEPASELLKRIEKENNSKKPVSLPQIEEEDEPLELPCGWLFVPLIALGT